MYVLNNLYINTYVLIPTWAPRSETGGFATNSYSTSIYNCTKI